jgi:hypothetical protein
MSMHFAKASGRGEGNPIFNNKSRNPKMGYEYR